MAQRLFTLLLLCVFDTGIVHAYQNYWSGRRWYCGLQDEPVVTLVWSTEKGGYILPSTSETAATDNLKVTGNATTGSTFNNTSRVSSLGDGYVNGSKSVAPFLREEEPMRDTIEVRRCPCWTPHPSKGNNPYNHRDDFFYCPMPYQYCGLDSRRYFTYDAPPVCENNARKLGYVAQLWRVTNLVWAFMISFVICSNTGRKLIKHVFLGFSSFFLPPLNPWIAKRIIQNKPSQANHMMLSYFRRESQRIRYRQQHPDEDDDDDDADRPLFQRIWRFFFRKHHREFVPPGSGTQLERMQLLQLRRNPQQLMLLVPDPDIISFFEAFDTAHQTNSGPRPLSLKLKTKVYKRPKQKQALSDDDDNTSIVTPTRNSSTKGLSRMDSVLSFMSLASAKQQTPENDDNNSTGTGPDTLQNSTSGKRLSRMDSVLSFVSIASGKSISEPITKKNEEGGTKKNEEGGDNNNEDDDENNDFLIDNSCTICYLPLEDGERVGVLPTCNHTFHVSCLKIWLVRRNVCPLCLSENIATAQFDNNDVVAP